MRLLRDLTGGRFRDGAVAPVVAMEFWARGEAPTFESSPDRGRKPRPRSTGCSRRIRLPDRPPSEARRRRLEGLPQGEAKSALETLARIAPVERPPAGCFGRERQTQ